MDYSISKQRLSNLVGALVLQHFPKFTDRDSEVGTKSDGDDTYILYYGYRDENRMHPIVYAKYYVWKKVLELNMDLFDKLESGRVLLPLRTPLIKRQRSLDRQQII